MAIYQLDEHVPEVHDTAYVAESAEVIGRVRVGEQASVWYGVVARGDTDWLTIGARSNVQDNSVLHADAGQPLVIGEDVTVGHQCVLHGCSIGDGSLIGIGAVVLNGARIGRGSVVGAQALVTEGKEFPDYSMIIGSPAKAVRTLTPEQAEGFARGAARYVAQGERHARGLKRVG
jgi:carbonic anhydrase/acetyltransferase-like protein (isoleucine patch superfamily)